MPGVGGVAEVAGRRARVVDLVRGLKSLGPPYIFCSLRTAYQLQLLLRDYPGHTMYLLGRCRKPADDTAVAGRLRERPDLSAFTREEFSARTQIYWATRTEAAVVENLNVIAIASLAEAVGFLSGQRDIVPRSVDLGEVFCQLSHTEEDFVDVEGQKHARWALLNAPAGSHKVLMIVARHCVLDGAKDRSNAAWFSDIITQAAGVIRRTSAAPGAPGRD